MENRQRHSMDQAPPPAAPAHSSRPRASTPARQPDSARGHLRGPHADLRRAAPREQPHRPRPARRGTRARATGSPTWARSPSTTTRSSSPAPRPAPCWCPVNWRLTAPEVEPHPAGLRHPAAVRGGRVRADRRAACPTAPPETIVALGAPSTSAWKADAPRHRPAAGRRHPRHPGRPALHQRHHRAAQGRRARPPQLLRDPRRTGERGTGLDRLAGGRHRLIGIPGFHIGGLWWATQNFNAGTTVVAMRAFAARQAVDLIRELGITTACVVPGDAAHDADRTRRRARRTSPPCARSSTAAPRSRRRCWRRASPSSTASSPRSTASPRPATPPSACRPAAHVPGGPLHAGGGPPLPGRARQGDRRPGA